MKKIDVMWQYVILAYLLFWVMELGICGTASMVFQVSGLTLRWLANLCAWAPTFALLILFKKLKPAATLSAFYRQSFRGKIRLDVLLLTAFAVFGGTLLSVWILSLAQRQSFFAYFAMGQYSLPLTFILSIFSGPTGEESGWRGYLRPALENRYGFLPGSLLLGLVWAFWHAVLWFVDSDFTGLSLIPYIFANVVVMTSLSVMMNVVLKSNNNLFYAVWIHFCFNFLYGFLKADIWFYIILSAVYAIIALCFLLPSLQERRREIPALNGNGSAR